MITIPVATLRNILWLLATLEISISLYVLVQNIRNRINLHLAFLMLVFAVNTLGLGMLVTAQNLTDASLPMVLLSASSLQVISSIMLILLVLLYPEPPRWLRIARSVVYGIIVIPAVLILTDVFAGTALWYNIGSEPYLGGYIGGAYYQDGLISNIVRAPLTYSMGLLTLVPPLFALFERKNTPTRRRLAAILLGVQILTVFLQVGLRSVLPGAESAAAVNVVFAIGYGYIVFDLLFRSNTMQSGRLQTRLTLLSMVVTVPALILVGLVAAQTGRDLLISSAQLQLQTTNSTLKSNVNVWVDQNVRALQQLELSPDIRSMNPDLQKPALERLTQSYPYMYLVSTTGLDGLNIARSDDNALTDYSDRAWVNGALAGQAVTYQTLIGRTSGEPALVVSVPIQGQNLSTQGILMFAAGLDDLQNTIESAQAQDSGLDFYVVDAQNQLILSSESHLEDEHKDDELTVPIQELRASGPGQIRYVDTEGESWLAYADELPNDWSIVVEREERVLLSAANSLQNINLWNIGVSIVLTTALIFATVRQALRPIGSLTNTVGAIIDGDLEQRALVESNDELGELATSFNTMTDRVNELIAGLEGRVQQRTAALEQRSQYLQASADVSSAVSSILDTQELFSQVVNLIQERFDLYYVGLFQVDAAREWAVLRAGTGEAGRAMLARDHRILIGTGMVGWSINNNQSRITSRAEEDAVRVVSSELSETRSEAALPLTSRGEVLGALTVQSADPDFFDADTLTVLETMADQIAVAIDNAGLYTTMQVNLDTERRAMGQMLSISLESTGSSANDWVYNRSTKAFDKPDESWHPAMVEARQTARVVMANDESQQKVAVPIRVRDEVVGVLDLNRSDSAGWTQQELAFLETISEQLGAALESALLYETSQHRASREQMIRQITENISAASTVEDAMRRAMQALADVANANQVAVRIGTHDVLSVKQGDAHE